jgi:signal transduction histidine kinase
LFTIKGKVILSSSIVFSVTLIIFAFWLYKSTRRSEYVKFDSRLESLSEEMQSEIEEEFKEGLFPDSQDLKAVKIEGLPTTYMQITDTAGSIILGAPQLAFSVRLNPLREYRSRSYLANIRIENKIYRSSWSKVEIDEQYPYILQLAAPLSEVEASLRQLRITLLISMPLAILISAFAVYLITSMAFRPLATMADTAKRISATSLNQRLNMPHVKDELYSLSMTLNQMFERLESAFINQRHFIADASHEIRTPLTIINTELEFARKMASESEVVKSIDSCLEEIDRLGRMTDSLLLLAKLDASSLPVQEASFRLDELVIEVVQNMIKLAHHKSITINPFIENALEIRSDIDLLRQAMINIIDNAIKYSSSGGEITVSLNSPAMTDNSAKISIKDNGPGINDTDLNKIFKRFFRGENNRKESNGSGLGLPIAQKLVSILGGSIDLKSEIGKGTEVTIKLPLAK